MTKKASGLLYEDYVRALKAAKRFGAKKVRVCPDGSIEFSLGDEGPDGIDETGPEPRIHALKLVEPKLRW